MKKMKSFPFLILFIVICCFMNMKLYSDISDIVFDDTQVQEFYLTFAQGNYWQQMLDNYANGLNEYILATFEFNGEIYDSVGVRFKGNASMNNYPSDKKPFKIKFDEYIEDQEFYGISKLSLSNEYKDPSFLREKIMFETINKHVPSSRTNFIKLFINGAYWGLYTNVEQINKGFVERNFGFDENGNLFKGDPHGSLEWLGPDPEPYYLNYELKTNEEINDWSDLIHFIDKLNNTNINELQDSLETVFHPHNFLFFTALNNFFVNLDSYVYKAHNYYIYHREDTDNFVHIPWDFNLSFGNYTTGLSLPEMIDLPIYWYGGGSKPLVEQLFQIPDYCEIYEMDYKYIIDNTIIIEDIFARIDSLVNLIRPAVYADTLKMYSNDDFENSINENIIIGNVSIFGIKSFIADRRESIVDQLLQLNIRDRTTGIYINEFMANNETTISDEFGEYDDWVEIYNSNSEAVNMEGLFLTDDPMIPDRWEFPNVEIPANGFLLVWTDDDEEQGALHTNFRLNTDGEFIGLYEIDGIVSLDTLSYGIQDEDISFGRYPDGDENWVFMSDPSPGYSNNYIPIEVDFIADPLIGLVPLEVEFVDTSIGNIISWDWDFDNDGTIDSNEQNPLFTYLETGIYSVSLTVFDGMSSETETKIDYIEVTETGLGEDLPSYSTKLYNNHPNPFNPTTTIKFSLKEDSNVSIKIYNITGAAVRTIIDGEMNAAYHEIIWDGKNNSGKQVGSGLYLYKMISEGNGKKYTSTKKMILLK